METKIEQSYHNANMFNKLKFSQIVWRNVIAMLILHSLAFYGLFLIVANKANWQTAAMCWFGYVFSGIGITAGAHRLWCHRAYKAKWPLRLLLALQNTMAFQNDIYEWCRDHRVHHKYSETNADPHNSKRGFFFAHMGWLLVRKHSDVIEKGQQIDMSDLWNDPIVRFQRKYYLPLVLIVWGLIPAYMPHYFWNESLLNSFLICVILRYVFTLHCTWSVNSVAHILGSTPYNRLIEPKENSLVSIFALGEGYHNYHHTFPWDYSTSELGWKYNPNFTTLFIEFFEKCGLAYELKKPTPTMIQDTINNTKKKYISKVTLKI